MENMSSGSIYELWLQFNWQAFPGGQFSYTASHMNNILKSIIFGPMNELQIPRQHQLFHARACTDLVTLRGCRNNVWACKTINYEKNWEKYYHCMLVPKKVYHHILKINHHNSHCWLIFKKAFLCIFVLKNAAISHLYLIFCGLRANFGL